MNADPASYLRRAPATVVRQASVDYREADAAAVALARRAQAGDIPAFSELVCLLAGRLYRYFRVRGFADADAQDLVQETVLKAYSQLARYDADRPFLPWLFTIASRLAANHRRRARPADPLPDDLPAADACPRSVLAAADQRRHLWLTARQTLSPDQHEALWLHYGEDLAVADIAAVMGKTRLHVKVLLHRARRRLQQTLRQPMAPIVGRRAP